MNTLKLKSLIFLISTACLFTACNKNTDSLASTAETQSDTGVDTDATSGDTDDMNAIRPSEPFVIDMNNRLLLRWTSLLLELERYALGMRPNASARALAYIHLAAYETVLPGMSEYVSNDERLSGLRIRDVRRNSNIDWQIALNTAYADVLDHFLLNVTDNRKSQIATLESQIESRLVATVPNSVVEESKEWGAYVAEQIIAYSQTDQEAEAQILDPQPNSYVPPTGDGFWTFSAEPERALFPYWQSVRTFVIAPDETSTVAPIDYSEAPGSPYLNQMMEVYNDNNQAKLNDDEQLWIAEFWSDDVEELMMSPPARQFSIAQQLARQRNLNLGETLVLFLKLGFSLNDAAVATWKYKYQYMVMRPNVYIHEFIDPDFQTNLFRLVYWPNPSFPGYPSGHSCFASAAAGVFIDAFGNRTNFTDRTHEGRQEFRGAPRTFRSFREMADENGYSRIPLGVHIRMDCTEGLRLGYEISDAINDLSLKRIQ